MKKGCCDSNYKVALQKWWKIRFSPSLPVLTFKLFKWRRFHTFISEMRTGDFWTWNKMQWHSEQSYLQNMQGGVGYIYFTLILFTLYFTLHITVAHDLHCKEWKLCLLNDCLGFMDKEFLTKCWKWSSAVIDHASNLIKIKFSIFCSPYSSFHISL